MKYDVFICHSGEDATLSATICKRLEEMGIICWIAPRNICGGKPYSTEIVDAINESTALVIVVSKHSNCSRHVLSEIDLAFNANKILIPFIIDDSQMDNALKYYLQRFQWVSVSEDLDQSISDLGDVIISQLPQRARRVNVDKALSTVKEAIVTRYIKVDEILAMLGAMNHIDIVNDSSIYDIFINDRQEVMIELASRSGGPEDPRLIYDGKSNKAILMRDKEAAVFFNNITREAIVAFDNVDKILICEIQGENKDLVREYFAAMNKIDDINSIIKHE